MAKTYIETGTVNHNFQTNNYDNVLNELNLELEQNRKNILTYAQMLADDVTPQLSEEMIQQYESEMKPYGRRMEEIANEKHLLAKYPAEFPVLYALKQKDADGEAEFEMHEILADTPDIVTEDQDILPREEQLEILCTLEGAGRFGISVQPYDKAGEESRQLRARINFSQKAIDDLNEARLKKILEFCEKRGLSVYDLDLPMKDGLIDVDEKLAMLTQRFLEERKLEAIDNPGPSPDAQQSEDFIQLNTEVRNLPDIDKLVPPKSAKKEKNLDDMRGEFIDFIEKDLKKSFGLTYFVRTRNIDGLKTIVFSLYDKPNRENEKLDGLPDKNKNHVPTYSYRLYLSEKPNNGGLVFGYATPGGKKMDDVMAGDIIGVIKKTGATHINFSNLPNVEKMVWMLACAEKGIVPIGVSINMAKAKSMVESARKKLTDEEFVVFKRNLSEQMIENAAKKCADKDDKKYGLTDSELSYIQSLRASYDFENFRIAYEDNNGLYQEVLNLIDKGAKDKQQGAKITFGAMRALRTVYDVYEGFETYGEFLKDNLENKLSLDKEEIAQLNTISANKKMTELSVSEFMLLYRTILPKQIQKAEKEILEAYADEDSSRIKRNDNVILGEIFGRVKGSVNEINILLARKKIDALTLPLEHKGVFYKRQNVQNLQKDVKTADKTILGKTEQNMR